jgi:hypothetical protein
MWKNALPVRLRPSSSSYLFSLQFCNGNLVRYPLANSAHLGHWRAFVSSSEVDRHVDGDFWTERCWKVLLC